MTSLGILTLYLLLPGCNSLKEKRGRLKPLLARLHREFNVSVAEIDHQDAWGKAVIACATVSSDRGQTNRVLQQVVYWIETTWRDVEVSEDQIELL